MPDTEIALKVLLRQRHLQGHQAFCREYDRVAKRIEPHMIGKHPGRAQFYKWLSGRLLGLPYADHCRILEAMFPNWTADRLFAPHSGHLDYVPDSIPTPQTPEPRPTSDTVVEAQPPTKAGTEKTARPIGLRPHIATAFTADHVTIDFAGFSGETLHGAMQEPLDQIRSGELRPQSIAVRILVPDTTAPMTIPCRAEDRADSPEFRARAHSIMRRHLGAITDSFAELHSLGLVEKSEAIVKVHHAAPLFKLYILNNTEAFFGFYPVVPHTIDLEGTPTPMYDLMGKDALLFQHSVTTSQYVTQARIWFDSMWTTLADEYAL
ncbi:hypothetical protein [Actinokineospora spheciospongiae]|uniref:hypothetical protein n=1 Tax=Actinokineospora spheciospongiae TaxID=909613 RepID=UPI00068B9FBE|nr:hypothetical protein [Actinokineospora spheciospongiae]